MVGSPGETISEERKRGDRLHREGFEDAGGERRDLAGEPEDLGRTKSENPSSIWTWPGVRDLQRTPGVTWGAFYQEDFGTEYLKPTRLLHNLPDLGSRFVQGNPLFNDDGFYAGPLEKRTPQMMLSGRQNGDFTTLAAAAWPPQLCKEIAERCFAFVALPTDGSIPSGGAFGLPPMPGELSQGAVSDGTRGAAPRLGFEKGPAESVDSVDTLPVAQVPTSLGETGGGGNVSDVTQASRGKKAGFRRKITAEEVRMVRKGRAEYLDGLRGVG